MISVEALHKRFGQIKAVDGISFTINRGEVFGLLGPNGAGKTTTINMMVGALKPDRGFVQINGVTDPTQPSLRRIIGNVPQSLSIYEDLTAEENLSFFGKLYGMRGSPLRERVDWALDLAQLADRSNSRVRTFSGGMKRRLNLVCALVHDPPLLLLDEPTVGVDPQSRNLIFDRIEQLRGQGKTVVYTTHYMEEAQRLCRRVAIIDNGRILDLDTVPNLIRKHGGKAVVTAELAAPPDPSVALPDRLEGLSLRFESDDPLEEVTRLKSKGVEYVSLRVDQADLESVFLYLTGRSLRD